MAEGAPSQRAEETGRGPAAVCFGEALLCFKPGGDDDEDLSGGMPSVQPMRRDVGGAELNTACALASLGRQARWLSVLPDSPLAEPILRTCAAAGVDASQVIRDSAADAEVGTLYTQPATRRVVYQRRHSSFSVRVDAQSFDWQKALRGAGVFNSTGINPALSAPARACWLHAVRAAAKLGVPVSFDLNWRPALCELAELWQTARPLLRDGAVTLLVVARQNLAPLAELEGLATPGGKAPQSPAESVDAALALLTALRAKLQVPLIACCFKDALEDRPGWQARWSAVVAEGGPPVTTQTTPVKHNPREPLGGGDAWLGGFLDAALDAAWFGLASDEVSLRRDDLRRAARRGDLLAALSQEQPGDVCLVPRRELAAAEAAADGGGAVIGADAEAALRQQFAAALRRCPVVPVITVDDPSDARPLALALAQGGMTALEVTFRTDAAEAAITAMARAVPNDVLVGAGTVLTERQAERAVKAGARFLVSPGLDPAIVAAARRLGVPLFPGCATATDVAAALRLRLTDLKFFPAEPMGGVKMLKALSAPHPRVRWMPTGGIDLAKLESYLAVPQVLACGGSWMVAPALVKARRWDEVRRLAAEAAQRGAALRGAAAAPRL